MKPGEQQCFFKIEQLNAQSICLIFLFFALPGYVFASGHIGHSIANHSSGLPGDLLIFPDSTIISRFDQDPNNQLADSEIIPSLNVFYTADYRQFRFLGEWLLSACFKSLDVVKIGHN